MTNLIPPLRSFNDAAKGVKLAAWDFDGVFTDNHVYTFGDGTEAVRTSRADGIGLRRLESLGIYNIVISGEDSPVVQARCDKLKIRCISACADKRAVLTEIARNLGLDLSECAYLGNDVNDIGVLQVVGLPVLVADALLDDDYGFFKLPVKGGEGAVRYLCDQIMAIQRGAAALREDVWQR